MNSANPGLQQRLGQAAAAVLEGLDQGGKWQPLAGLDSDSAVWEVEGRIVKARRLSPFRAGMLKTALSDIHAALAPAGLTPRLLSITYHDDILVSEFERIDATGPAHPGEIGFALGCCHRLLAAVSIRSTVAWTGFYGEFQEFRFLVPLVTDNSLRERATRLLPAARYREHTEPVHYIHRDLNPMNVLKGARGVRILDWEMAYGGHREDDVAMAICCLADSSVAGSEEGIATEFLAGYRISLPTPWATLSHPLLRSAIALAGLRQAVAGWFTDEGDTSASYWPNIRKRLETACQLSDLMGNGNSKDPLGIGW